jgi:excisionase family DNA binding protein
MSMENEKVGGDESERMLSAAQVARRLALDPSTVRRLAADGQLPGVRIGGQWRFDRRRLEAALST